MKTLSLSLVALALFLGGAAHAQKNDPGVNWIPGSKLTSTATGAVQVEAGKLTFEGGRVIQLEPVDQRVGDGKVEQIYKIVGKDAVGLCYEGAPATFVYLMTYSGYGPTTLTLNVYDSKKAPMMLQPLTEEEGQKLAEGAEGAEGVYPCNSLFYKR